MSYGVARLETSFVIWDNISMWDWRHIWKCYTYHIDAAISRHSNNCVKRTKVNTHYRHLDVVSLCVSLNSMW
jgi:hypothetical protein